MITFDFETRAVLDLRKLGVTRYATDPRTQVLCACWSYDDEEEVHLWHRGHPWIEKSPRPDELLERIAAGELFEAHNAGFEFHIWNEVLRREFPEFDVPLRIEQMRCSAAKASCLSLPRALGDAALALRTSERKDPDGQRLIQKLCKPMRRKKGSTEILFCEEEIEHRRNWKYCAQDVITERALSNALPEMTARELEYWFMDFRMNQRGIALDAEAVDEAIKLCGAEVDRLNAEMVDITDGRVLGGSKRIPFRTWANEQIAALDLLGVPFLPLPDTRADTLSFALYGVPTKAGDEAKIAVKPKMDALWDSAGEIGAKLRRSMEICLEVNRSSVAKFKQMQASVCPDGRLHDIMLYNGADRSGRWSGKGVQPHNFVRGYKKEMPDVWTNLLTGDLDYITLMEGPALPCLAKACRGALVASPGMELYAADFNAIEARKLAWMSGCNSMLHLFQTGGDPYIAMAASIYRMPDINPSDRDTIAWFKKEHANERGLGKVAVLGLGYQMSWEKFQATVWLTEGIWLDDEFCQMVVNVYRKEMCREVPKFWKATENAAIAAVTEGGEWSAGGDEFGFGAISYFVAGRFLHCRLPSGRLLAYLDPEVHSRITYRYNATNVHGKPCIVAFPAKIGVAMNRVKHHAEIVAERQRKKLTGDPPESFLAPHLSFMGRNIVTHKWQRCGTYGGALVENADQASSRDLLAEAMFRVDQDARFALLLSIHDEVIGEAPIGTATVREFEAIMSVVPAWAPGMPISAEGWVGSRLRK